MQGTPEQGKGWLAAGYVRSVPGVKRTRETAVPDAPAGVCGHTLEQGEAALFQFRTCRRAQAHGGTKTQNHPDASA